MMEAVSMLETIIKTMEKDANNFDGRSFNAKTVGEYLWHHGDAIQVLAEIVKLILENEQQRGKKALKKPRGQYRVRIKDPQLGDEHFKYVDSSKIFMKNGRPFYRAIFGHGINEDFEAVKIED